MGRKVTIIGAGSVGAATAYAMVVQGFASEIVLIDINTEKALGEALDIRQGVPFCSPVSIYAGDYADAAGSDIVVLTSGLPRKPGQTRLELAQANVNITRQIIPQITKHAPDAVYIIVANPVDILTYQFYKTSGLKENKIFGSGTILDTVRLRQRIAEDLKVNASDVQAYVFGEHGDSEFVPWSLAHVSNIHVDAYPAQAQGQGLSKLNYAEVEEFTRKSGAEVIKRKGATFYAIGISVCHLCKAIFSPVNSVLTVSTMMNGEYGISDVSLSTLSLVGPNGYQGKVITDLTDEEIGKLRHSADCLKDIIKNLEL